MKTAILVDGGFYRKQARFLFGDKEPNKRADELINIVCAILKKMVHTTCIEFFTMTVSHQKKRFTTLY